MNTYIARTLLNVVRISIGTWICKKKLRWYLLTLLRMQAERVIIIIENTERRARIEVTHSELTGCKLMGDLFPIHSSTGIASTATTQNTTAP